MSTANSSSITNFNSGLPKKGEVAYSKLYLYKIKYDKGSILTDGSSAWSEIQANSAVDASSQATNNKWSIGGMGSTLPLAYDPVYTSDDYCAKPLFNGAIINMYDACRRYLLSKQYPGFSEGKDKDGNIGVSQKFFDADPVPSAAGVCKKGQYVVPHLTAAAIYKYPRQTSCTDTVVAWPTPLKDGWGKAYLGKGWHMMASTKAVLFIVFLTFGILFLIVFVYSCFRVCTSPYTKEKKTMPSKEEQQFKNMMGRMNRQVSENHAAYGNQQQPYAPQPMPMAQRQWSGSQRSHSQQFRHSNSFQHQDSYHHHPMHQERSYEIRPNTGAPTRYQNPPNQMPALMNVGDQVEMVNIPPYRPNNFNRGHVV